MSDDLDQSIEDLKQSFKEIGVALNDQDPMNLEEIIQDAQKVIDDCEARKKAKRALQGGLFLEWLQEQERK